jgi:hypothetical protein
MLKTLLSFSLVTIFGVLASGQTSADLSARYPAISAYEVRPGILMTALYGEDGQVCQMTIERRHSTPKEKDIDLSSTISRKAIDQLTDELVPAAERGPATSRWLDADSYVAGGVSDIKHSFENVSIEIVGSTSQSCNGGDEVVIIRWRKRGCAETVADIRKPSRHTAPVRR